MVLVQQILQNKGYDVWSLPATASVYEALVLMAEKDIGALLVMDERKLVGIFSERDYARKVFLQGKSSRETQLGEIMTGKVYFVRPGQTTDECMALMTKKHIRHLPVMDDSDEVMGVISIGDVVKAIISQHEFTITQLENYITGRS